MPEPTGKLLTWLCSIGLRHSMKFIEFTYL